MFVPVPAGKRLVSPCVGEGLRVGDEDENENWSGCHAGDRRLFHCGVFSHADRD
jgi:hypothetical protein